MGYLYKTHRLDPHVVDSYDHCRLYGFQLDELDFGGIGTQAQTPPRIDLQKQRNIGLQIESFENPFARNHGIGCQEMTLEEIGDKFGLTRERVRQIKEKAIRRLRQSSRSKLLKTYLG